MSVMVCEFKIIVVVSWSLFSCSVEYCMMMDGIGIMYSVVMMFCVSVKFCGMNNVYIVVDSNLRLYFMLINLVIVCICIRFIVGLKRMSSVSNMIGLFVFVSGMMSCEVV